MSSMRNAVHRRQHRERGQLEGRGKWGILEKHKDYSLRAQDYNLKKQKLGRLREKARDRNVDEFAYGMLSDKNARQGKHGTREASSLSHDTVKLLKTQDAGYLRTVGEKARREMEKLEQEVKLQKSMMEVLGEGKKGGADDEEEEEEEDDFDEDLRAKAKKRKVVFAESREDQKKLGARPVDGDGEDEDMVDDEGDDSFGNQSQQKQKQPTKKQLEAEQLAYKQKRAADRLKRRAAASRVRKLEALRKQHAEITTAERELDLQRARMTNSIGGVNKNGLKWKVKERKR
ncbi:small-subunit processome [Talaromyces proteolyticus]|uniref:Small-subunit processome n=1 Tax=Talaromyces proteolyticus TaxID=1131652 RepID=A0AAD4KT93_9EURO|nr:small-subunit processome [Talaromyces proteolyticus]KAH8698813.1 small-subunit processome [Talaromyces proteolyticus]